jgi:hypothetical protein
MRVAREEAIRAYSATERRQAPPEIKESIRYPTILHGPLCLTKPVKSGPCMQMRWARMQLRITWFQGGHSVWIWPSPLELEA